MINRINKIKSKNPKLRKIFNLVIPFSPQTMKVQ